MDERLANMSIEEVAKQIRATTPQAQAQTLGMLAARLGIEFADRLKALTSALEKASAEAATQTAALVTWTKVLALTTGVLALASVVLALRGL